MEISIHALRKESDPARQWRRAGVGISIHALRKESDGYVQEVADHLDISIHALRKESDFFLFWRLRPFINFNPRSP